MHLRRLRLTGFRNHIETDLSVEPGTVVITGGNGHGKSTLLEAMNMLSVGKSSRTNNYAELANHGVADQGGRTLASGLFVEGDATSTVQFEMTFTKPFVGNDQRDARVTREWKIDGTRQRTIDIVGRANVVLFEVSDLELVLGGAARRRRYLDILISQYDTEYKRSLLRLRHIRRSRNALLQSARAGADIDEDIEFWDQRFLDETVKIVLTRRDVLNQLDQRAQPVHNALSTGQMLELKYLPSLGTKSRGLDLNDINTEKLTEIMEQSLEEVRQKEIAVGRMVIGPHLDDFEVRLNGQRARHYASRGQARTVALALRLSEAELVNALARRTPVMLFDDVMSEMDANRRSLILERISDFDQTFMTSARNEDLGEISGGSAQKVHIQNGTVTTLN